MTTRRRWTAEEEQQLTEMWQAGRTAREIAAELDRTTTAIQTRVGELRRIKGIDLYQHVGGARKNGLRRETLLAISGLWHEKGYAPTLDEIAGRLNIGRSTAVYRIKVLQRAGWINREPEINRTITITAKGAAELLQ